jgi:hypothetical protein
MPSRDRIIYWEDNFGLMVRANGHESSWCNIVPAKYAAE